MFKIHFKLTSPSNSWHPPPLFISPDTTHRLLRMSCCWYNVTGTLNYIFILNFQNNDKLTTKKPLYEKRDNSIVKFIQNRQYLASWLKSVAMQDWFRNVENSPKCYFKEFCKMLRVIITKCRTCNHKLPIIETGRWNNLINIERCFNIWWRILLQCM